MFPTLGFPELLLILAVCVLIFGAKRLPEIGSGMAKGIRSFKKGLSEDPELPAQKETETAKVSGESAGEGKS
jgi:sec-independent protein translocase protein TatA